MFDDNGIRSAHQFEILQYRLGIEPEDENLLTVPVATVICGENKTNCSFSYIDGFNDATLWTCKLDYY